MIGSIEYNREGVGFWYIVWGIMFGRCDERAEGEGLWHNPGVTECSRDGGSVGIWSRARGGGDKCD